MIRIRLKDRQIKTANANLVRVRPKVDKSISASNKGRGSKGGKRRTSRLLEWKKFDPETKHVENFMTNRLSNVVLNADSRYIRFSGRIRRNKYKTTADSMVMVNASRSNYYELPLHLVKRLCKIDYMIIQLKIKIVDPGEALLGSFKIVAEKTRKVSSLGQFLDYLNVRYGIRESLNIYQMGSGWCATVMLDETMEVLFKNGKSEKYDFLEFVNEYKLMSYLLSETKTGKMWQQDMSPRKDDDYVQSIFEKYK